MAEDFDNWEIAGLAFLLRFFPLGIRLMRLSHKLALPALGAFCLSLSSCTVMKDYEKKQAQVRADRELAALRSQARAEHAVFRAHKGWKADTYRNKALLEQATPDNVSLEIALGEQRGFLLVNGAIAMDFPLASGKKSHPTPAGSYTIRGKVKDYHSNLYGKIVDPAGTVLVADADTRQHPVPEGASFAGAAMPYWMRLSDTGVGLHVGHVPGGSAASHGCVRLRRQTASYLFSLVKVGTPVVIAENAPALAE